MRAVPMRVIVTGATKWNDAEAVRRELAALPAGSVIVFGDCSGADELAGEAAAELGLAAEPFCKESDDFRAFGPEAWKRLNERMLEAGADLVLAFNSDIGVPGKALGTGHMIELARRAGIEVRAFR